MPAPQSVPRRAFTVQRCMRASCSAGRHRFCQAPGSSLHRQPAANTRPKQDCRCPAALAALDNGSTRGVCSLLSPLLLAAVLVVLEVVEVVHVALVELGSSVGLHSVPTGSGKQLERTG